MGVLDQIAELRQQGMSDDDIIQQLQERGIPPKAINDALNNEQIKKAVSDEYNDAPEPSDQNNQESSQENYYSPQQQNPQEYYSANDNSQVDYSQGMDTSTIIEVAEQVFSEKIQKIQKQADDLTEFKAIASSKIDGVSERLKRVEMMIDKLQISILEKVGSYGSNLESIKKEMSMMQDTFGKAVGSRQRETPKQNIGMNPENNSKQQKPFPKRMDREQ